MKKSAENDGLDRGVKGLLVTKGKIKALKFILQNCNDYRKDFS